MTKIKKIGLGIIGVGYLIRFCLLIWSKFSEGILSFLRRINVVNRLPNDTLRDYVGISQFIRTQLSGECLTNVQVKIKNTRHR
jgi:hypothetical protein